MAGLLPAGKETVEQKCHSGCERELDLFGCKRMDCDALSADGNIAGLRHGLPAAAVTVERLGHHATASAKRSGVKCRRIAVGRVAHRVKRLAVGESGGELEVCLHAAGALHRDDAGSGTRGRAERIVSQSLFDHQKEEQFRICGAFDLVVELVAETGFELAADSLEIADLAIMHERPAAIDEGVAIDPAGRPAGRGAHMGKKKTRPDLPAQAFQVRIGPGRQDIAKEAGFRALAISGKAETVGVGGRLCLGGAVALGNERVAGRRDDVLKEDRFADIGSPTTHALASPRRDLRLSCDRPEPHVCRDYASAHIARE